MYLSDKLEIHWKGQSSASMEEWGQEGCGQAGQYRKEQDNDQISRTRELQGKTKSVGPAYLKKDWRRHNKSDEIMGKAPTDK